MTINQDNLNLIRQSAAVNTATGDDELLESYRITSDKQLKPIEFVYRVFGKPCFPRGELVAVTGKAKSGKTLLNSMLMACCVRD